MSQSSVHADQLLAAALDFAARGWPVFPCHPQNKQPLLPRDRDPETGKPIKGTGGVAKATVEADQIRAWWRKWPRAMIGLATGHHRLFVLDFDPRADESTGEVFTLDRLKADLEAQMGCALPSSLTSITQSGGVHVWLLWPDDGGAAITNRGNLPQHVDVRGKGGYVIVPPSEMANGRAYRWLRRDGEVLGPDRVAPVEAPAALIAILRSGASRADAAARGKGKQDAAPPPRVGHDGEAVSEAQRKWALSAFDAEIHELRNTPVGGGRYGGRNEGAFHAANVLGQLVGAGALSESMVRAALLDAIKGFGSDHSDAVENGLERGKANPRDLSMVGQRSGGGHGRAGPPRPPANDDPSPSPNSPAPSGRRLPPASPSFQSGTVETLADQTERVQAQVRKVAGDWLQRRLSRFPDMEGKEQERTVYGIGRRCAAALFDLPPPSAWPAERWAWVGRDGDEPPWAKLDLARLDSSYEAGFARGFDIGPILVDLVCAMFPMTDFGLGERFNLRHGSRFRFTTAKGWLGWDGRRWAVLDQEKDGPPPAELQAAIFETVRDIQREARIVAITGERPDGLDFAYLKNGKLRWFHEDLALFGRQCETAGKPSAIAKLAQRWLTVPIERFDCDPLAINVLNGTLKFSRVINADGSRRVAVELRAHDRDDLNTRLAPVDYDPDAPAPIWDDFFGWAQPVAAVRDYLMQTVGYTMTGLTGEQKLWFHYGKGGNGKSVFFDTIAHVLGDYSGTIGIETFLDQGIKKRGEQASPDLARLGGVRFLRASEPERGAKLNEALIKAATGGEPMAVRALHRGFFDLMPAFKLHIAGNYRPDIPGTDEGIWRRMKLVPWSQHRAENERDDSLTDKLKAEANGIFTRMVIGLLDWLEHGLVEPEEVTAATAEYREDSDPLARFLSMCVETDEKSRVQSSRLYEVFVAWAKAVGEREWSQKGFTKAMKDKGYSTKQSNGMQWPGMKLVKDVSDFIDAEGRVRTISDDPPASPAGGDPPSLSQRPPDEDDDFVPGF